MVPGPDERFPKSARLRTRTQFLEIQSSGRRANSRFFVGLAAMRNAGPSRLGITVTRQVGSAVVRNRLKRLVREAFRRGVMRLPGGLDLVVIARPSAASADSHAISDDLALLGRRVRHVVERAP